MRPIALDDLHQSLLADIERRGLVGVEGWEADLAEPLAPDQHFHIAWQPETGRAGILLVGGGSSGETHWTVASSPADAVFRLLNDTQEPC